MAEQAEREDDDLELDIDDGQDTQSGADTEAGGEGNDTIEGGDADDEIEVSFDGVSPTPDETDEPDLIQRLRAANREQAKKLAAFERGEVQATVPQKIVVGDKPTIESCDYDDDRFAAEFDAWNTRKAEAEKQEAEAGKAGEAQRAAFAEDLGTFQRNKTALKAKDFDAAEEEVVSAFSQMQSAIVIKVADDSAKVIYALGKHPAKLAELAAIEDPIKFAAAVVRLEGKLSVTTKRRTAPEPDQPARGSGRMSATSDKELERLEKEAQRTGDRTAVVAHKRKLKAQGRS